MEFSHPVLKTEQDNYQQTDDTLLLIIILILIITFTYLFDRYINPFSNNHKKYSQMMDSYINNSQNEFTRYSVSRMMH